MRQAYRAFVAMFLEPKLKMKIRKSDTSKSRRLG